MVDALDNYVLGRVSNQEPVIGYILFIRIQLKGDWNHNNWGYNGHKNATDAYK